MKTAFIFLLVAITHIPMAKAQNAQTIEQYNQALPYWGVSWAPEAKGSINGYHTSFYTGFVMRSEFPQRIHIRTARGNQTRVSVILDDQTISDYMYDLKKRYEFYKVASSSIEGSTPIIRTVEHAAPQLENFLSILESHNYGILSYLQQADLNPTDLYQKSLQALQQLNPGRVFLLNFDLTQEFLNWKNFLHANQLDLSSPTNQVLAINSILWGRVNYTDKPSDELIAELQIASDLANTSPAETAFLNQALKVFKMVTGTKYAFRTVANGNWRNAIECSSFTPGACTLTYPEFTTLYPTGSVKSFTKDVLGNRISQFATPGLWSFIDSGSRDDVDYIRNEPYYGWAPKMDFEAIGNGFHNPAVRFWGISEKFKSQLGIDPSHNTLWAVKRGGVSHGCLRLPLGHIWELRQIFPVENEKMKQIYFFGNLPQDFDVYDIDGDGNMEVMGVEYMISYDLQGAGSLERREGKDLEVATDDKLNFYEKLYGKKQVFNYMSGEYWFAKPSVSLPSYLDYQKKQVTARYTLNSSYKLYEQSYEKDKVQFYMPISSKGLTGGKHRTSQGKRIVRLMGRVKGCAPQTNKQTCGEAAFDAEATALFNEISKITGVTYE